MLLLTSTVVDYVCGLVIAGEGRLRPGAELPRLERGGARRRSQRVALVVSLVTNLSLLGFFKYFNFGVDTYDAVLRGARDSAAWGWRASCGSRCRSASASTRSSR